MCVVTAITLLYMCCTPRVRALEGVAPGKSLWGITLGSSRDNAVTTAQKRFADLGGKRHPPYIYKNGYVGDQWTLKMPSGETLTDLEILSRHNRVVQLRTWTSGERGQTNLSFARLLQRHHLQKRVYGFDSPEGGGWDCFYYDDVKKGVCFSLGVQDNFLLTYRPDSIIVHPPGVPVVTVQSGIIGKVVTGRNARAYANLADAKRVEEHETNDY